ncbi:MAG: imidazole glycerol phosphate synthase subunit HisH [Lachnospiraceae bacterium]|jgi:glutamine amidotransferase|nr:imidazole glycerol phosphate synthase subunit HisH [Lachnospiraceae bacterium]MCI1726088.1 imidazole glycerol phosphate synthase subunit HisH [Lachnospiraceae bacterium]
MIAILDYGMGNIGSIRNMLKKIGVGEIILTHDAEEIRSSDHLILPGVGAFDAGMARLNELGLAEVIRGYALTEHRPVLGICLGMQLLGNGSEEGSLPGLSLIPFSCRKFSFGDASELKIPHMGWDRTYFSRESKLTEGLSSPQRYYYVHSYHAVCEDRENVLMTCSYGYDFAAAVQRENVYGVQFHPEKSHLYGMALLKNFVEKS